MKSAQHITVNNVGNLTVVYEVVFGDAGSAEFIVQPGGSFDLKIGQIVPSINVNATIEMGVRGQVGSS
jgi:hypothetical protein